jgi:hypothetical protein
LHEALDRTLIFCILGQLVFILVLFVDIVSQIIVLLLFLLQVGSITERRQVVEGKLKSLVVEKQVSPKSIDFIEKSWRSIFLSVLKQLKTLYTDEDSLGL